VIEHETKIDGPKSRKTLRDVMQLRLRGVLDNKGDLGDKLDVLGARQRDPVQVDMDSAMPAICDSEGSRPRDSGPMGSMHSKGWAEILQDGPDFAQIVEADHDTSRNLRDLMPFRLEGIFAEECTDSRLQQGAAMRRMDMRASVVAGLQPATSIDDGIVSDPHLHSNSEPGAPATQHHTQTSASNIAPTTDHQHIFAADIQLKADMEHLKASDQSLWRSLTWVLENDMDSEDTPELFFSVGDQGAGLARFQIDHLCLSILDVARFSPTKCC
jgi:hypothetical protein